MSAFSGWTAKVAATIAVVAGAALAIGGLTPAARADDAAVTNATQVNQLAARVDELRIGMAIAIPTQGEKNASRYARDAMSALLPRLEADLPAAATPEALAARDALTGVAKEYISQFGIAARRAGMKPLDAANEMCRLSFYAQERMRLGADLTQFDASADALAAQSGVAIAHLSGKDTSQWQVDRERTGAASLCVVGTVQWGSQEILKAYRAKNGPRFFALTNLTARNMTRSIAFLEAHKPTQGSPYRASWRATVAYAKAQRAWQAVLRELVKTGHLRQPVAAKRLEASIPSQYKELVKTLQGAGLLPVAKSA